MTRRFGMAWLLALSACSWPGRDATARPESAFARAPASPLATDGPPPVEHPDAPPPPVASPACGDPGNVLVFVAPEHPSRTRPMRAIAVVDRAIDASLALTVGATRVEVHARAGGPPYFWLAETDGPANGGTWQAIFTRDAACGGAVLATHSGKAAPRAPAPPPALRTQLWATRNAWDASYENLFSAWVQHLFDAPEDAQPSWKALHEVLRDRSRNFLFDYLGAGEDEAGITVRPDCADLPYFLRAYFAQKLLLPFAWSRCGRDGDGPPHCVDLATSEEPFPPPDAGAPGAARATSDAPVRLPAWADPNRNAGSSWDNNAKRIGEFLRTTLADAARSGAGRTPAADEDSDFYPVALSTETLRPGTIFGDPYGHVLVVAARLPQTPERAGILFAVDGQPDGTVARKRFWRGNFLFAIDPSLGAAGFKRFRPLVRDGAGHLMRPPNASLADYSATDQYAGGVEGFYDKMEDVLSPAPLDPVQALLGTVQALEEQVKTRVVSVDNGRRFLASGHAAAAMPEGETIFETTGEWEDFSTPSRDMRLLVAIDVAREVPSRVARRPARYAMPPGKSPDAVRAELEERLDRELRQRKVSYTRTDGSPWELSLAD
ncbi:MAG: hypothetical protein FWD17_04530, partial [Polyangiaceae bacterium]|nr:hypothetical protein [Polyangiaceae bacterium]